MPNVYIEARPIGRPQGADINDYVVEDHTDKVLATFKTQHEAIAGKLNNLVPRVHSLEDLYGILILIHAKILRVHL